MSTGKGPPPRHPLLDLFAPGAERSAPVAPPASVAPAALPTEGPKPLRVGQLLARIDGMVKREGVLVVLGELVDLKPAPSGHVYFALREGEARLACVMFRSSVQRLRFALKGGLEVTAHGRLSAYSARSQLQLVVEVVHAVGAGARALALAERKQRLLAAGYFHADKKKPLPLLPRRVGVVTSLSGAALQDVLRQVQRRMPNMPVLVRDTRVQGEDAPRSIARALWALDQSGRVDVILLVRGGGAAEELAAFDEEIVVRAIAACTCPIVTGVGHETDTTLADLAASARATTPTQAVDLAVPRADELRARLDGLLRRLSAPVRQRLARARVRTLRLADALADPRLRLLPQSQRVERLERRLTQAQRRRTEAMRVRIRAVHARLLAHEPGALLREQHDRLTEAAQALHAAIGAQQRQAQQRTALLTARLSALSPLAVLARGYAVATDADGHIVDTVEKIRSGDTLAVRVHDGSITATVQTTERSR